MKLKKRTGIVHWNQLCRLALCRSLDLETKPTLSGTPDTAIEIDWKTFAGPYDSAFSAMLLIRASRDGITVNSPQELASYVRAHLERGISTLNSIKKLGDAAVSIVANPAFRTTSADALNSDNIELAGSSEKI